MNKIIKEEHQHKQIYIVIDRKYLTKFKSKMLMEKVNQWKTKSTQVKNDQAAQTGNNMQVIKVNLHQHQHQRQQQQRQ